jgi:hypothetical protein
MQGDAIYEDMNDVNVPGQELENDDKYEAMGTPECRPGEDIYEDMHDANIPQAGSIVVRF